jgi:hypothetical protein
MNVCVIWVKSLRIAVCFQGSGPPIQTFTGERYRFFVAKTGNQITRSCFKDQVGLHSSVSDQLCNNDAHLVQLLHALAEGRPVPSE